MKFTGDTILRAMRAYSCIDRHGRWTEIPTRVSISTFRNPGPAPSPAPHPKNGSDVIDIEPEQLDEDLEEDEEEYDDPEDDPDDDSSVDEDDDDSELDERSASDQTACAVSPAQAVPKLPSDSGRGRKVTATACAASPRTSRGSPARSGAKQYSNPASRSDSTACAAPPAQVSAHAAPQSGAMRYSNPASPSESTTCAASPAQATPRDVIRGQNPKGRSEPDQTTCAGLPAQPAPHAHAWQNPLPPPAPLTDYPPVYPIYGPAIKNHRKTRYLSGLRFSNRR